MIFSEIYSVYYRTVAMILTELAKGQADEKRLLSLIRENAFEESVLSILPALKSEKWQLIKKDGTSVLHHSPTMPLTTLQKRWLKAIGEDPRIRLFDVDFTGLSDTEPLFTAEDYCVYDKYGDADPYTDENYIRIFHTILHALQETHPLSVTLFNRKGNPVSAVVLPKQLEYSEKDDKFRLYVAGCRHLHIVNVGRMIECKPYEGKNFLREQEKEPEMQEVCLMVTDERNAPERAMLHFAHFEKKAERIDGKHYRLYIRYNKEDETELLIRVLSFGPMVKAETPESFVNLVKNRLKKQMNIGRKL